MIPYTCKQCGKTGESKCQKEYCSSTCISRAWRARNPRPKSGNTLRHNEARLICGPDGMRRDKPDKWIKYMKANPIYFEGLGKVRASMLNIGGK
jgi:hypothetical protein